MAARKGIVTGLLIFLAACLPYIHTLPYPFHFDDRTNIVENQAVQNDSLGPEGLLNLLTRQPASARNRPVANLTFNLNYRLGGLNPAGYRTVNILIHGVNAVLVFLLMTQVLASEGLARRRLPGWLPAAAATLWALCPLHTESVTYIVQRMTSLSATFFLLACVVTMPVLVKTDSSLGLWRPLGGPLLLVLSAATKENGVLLPLALALLVWTGAEPGPKRSRRVAVIFAVMVVLGLAGTVLWLPAGTWSYRIGDGAAFGPWQRLLTQPSVLLWYVSLMLFPLPSRLNIDIQFPAAAGGLAPSLAAAAAVFWIVLLGVTARRAGQRPLAFLAVAWYLALSSLEASFLPLEMAFLHRTYLPSAFLFLLFAALAFRALKRWPAPATAVLMGALIVLSAVFTGQRNLVYRSPVALWSDAAAKSPGKARPHYNLGRAYQDLGELDRASRLYDRALVLRPDYYLPLAGLAYVAEERGDALTALNLYQQAHRQRPDDGEILYNLGRLLYDAGDPTGAANYLARALASPTLTRRGDAYWYLALIAEAAGDRAGAVENWERALEEYGPGSSRGRAIRQRLERFDPGRSRRPERPSPPAVRPV